VGGYKYGGPNTQASWIKTSRSNQPVFDNSVTPIDAPLPKPANQPVVQNNLWNQIKSFDLKGIGNDIGNGLSHGLSNTGTYTGNVAMANMLSRNTLPYMANIGNQQLASQQQHNDYLKANPVNSIAGQIGEQIPQIPLWLAGEGAVNLAGKGLSKLAPSLLPFAERSISKLPAFIKPVLPSIASGLKQGAVYGGVVAPVETIASKEGLPGLINREKQIVPMALGGAVLHGAGALLGKGISKVGSAISERGAITPIDLSVNPLAHTETTIPTHDPSVAPPSGVNPIDELSPNIVIPRAPAGIGERLHPTAEKVIAKLDDYEAGLKDYIASRKGSISSTPVDLPAAYVALGTVKLAKGTVKYSVWSADMVKDFGEDIRPQLKQIYVKATQNNNEIKAGRPIEEVVPMDRFQVRPSKGELGSLIPGGTPRELTAKPIISKPTSFSLKIKIPDKTSPYDINQPLPAPQSNIIINKAKESFNFKEAAKNFYTKVVNVDQPIVNADRTTGQLASNTKNVGGIVDHNLTENLVDKSGNKVGDSLKSTVEAVPKGQEKDFWTYMSQRHNIDRAREGKPVQTNFTPEMSTRAVSEIEQAHPEYKKIGNDITNWIDTFMRTWGVDTGIVGKEGYNTLRETYKSYFPTQRDFAELEKTIPTSVSRKFASQSSPIKTATGSSRDIINPVENIMNLVNRTVRIAKYNEVGQSLLNAVKESPEKMKQFAEILPEGKSADGDNILSVLVNGNPEHLQINYKPLLDSMNGLPKTIGNIPVLSSITNGFKGLITTNNPLFAIRNIFRDVPTAYVYGSEANPVKFAGGLLGAGKDILTNSPRLQRYKAVGGGGSNFFNSGNVAKSAAELTGNGNKIMDTIKAPLKAIQKFNNITETAPRLAEFNRVFNKTGNVDKALFASNDVTVNFSRGGNYTKNVDKGVPYLNAGVQGLDKVFRQFKDPKTALSTITKAGVAITTPDLAIYMINKDNPNYQALDNRTKDSNFLIPLNDGTFLKIPKSRELGVLFGSLFERSLRSVAGDKQAFKGFGNSVLTSFAPTNPFDSNITSPVTSNLDKNKDFANRAIIPQAMLQDKRSPYLQFDDKTSEIAKAIGSYSRNPLLPGGLSPKQIDYLIKSYTGVIAQFGLPLATSGGSPAKVLKTQFIADPTFSNQATTDFYDKLDKLSTAATDKNLNQNINSKTLTPEEDIKNSMTAISLALSKGTKQINALTASNDPDKDLKINDIKKKQLELTRRALNTDSPSIMNSIEANSKAIFK